MASFKKISKKATAILIAVITVFSVTSSAFFKVDAANRSNIPVVYVWGMGQENLYNDIGTENEKMIYPMQDTMEYLTAAAKENLSVFAKAFFTQKWDEFCDVLCKVITDMCSDMKLEKNGEPRENSGIKWDWPQNPLPDRKRWGTYWIYDYTFRYDWRRSPVLVADTLNEYINDVCRATGQKKVALVGRCLGTAIVSSYLTKYGGDRVSECIMYVGTANGALICSKAFCGEIKIDADGINRYVNDITLSETDYIDEFLKASIDLMEKTYKLDIAAWAVNNVYNKIYLNINPRTLRDSYGTFPSYWSMVSDNDYEKAKDVVFYGADRSEYEGLIEKTDDYHENVQVPLSETLSSLEKDGVKFAVIAKYGKQMTPVTSENNVISDEMVKLSEASFGAVTSEVDETLSEEYLKAAEENGTIKYISPDKKVDASTCLFRDSTWIIKDIDHNKFPACIDELMYEFINSNGELTVNNNERFPQYLVFDEEKGTFSPMNSENCSTSEERWNRSWFEDYKAVFKGIFTLIKNYFTDLFKKNKE
ncbi:MAG: alpha/beta fold hydrolase [Clostridiales bacterium]|nr:alpha/beta fold hydrolase [Clostridiales bacterium]